MGRYDFKTGPSYPEAGTSQNVFEAIGEVVNGFEQLDDQISNAIAFLLRRGEYVGRIVTAEISFRAKVNLLGVLFVHERPDSQELAEVRELTAACMQVEDRRNQIVHSRWMPDIKGMGVKRVKHTARGKRGLRTDEEALFPDQVDAVWQHCAYLDWSLDQLMYREFGEEYGSNY
jgi:hypothetical protein